MQWFEYECTLYLRNGDNAVGHAYFWGYHIILTPQGFLTVLQFENNKKMSSDSSKLEKKSAKGPSAEEIYAGFQQMRITQRGLATKLSELETDLNEHK